MLAFQGTAIVAMAKPTPLVRAEQPMAADLAADRAISLCGSASSSSRRDIIFVVNPKGTNGRTGEQWKKLLPYLRSRLGSECNLISNTILQRLREIAKAGVFDITLKNIFAGSAFDSGGMASSADIVLRKVEAAFSIVLSNFRILSSICESLTSGPCHAIDITREAIREGAHAVVAVGGDGTLHEVVNGFFWGGKPVAGHDSESSHTTALGLIPLGTGSDFARTLGWNNDPHDAIERIAKGLRSRIDVGVINKESGDPHYFINVADIHLSAKAGYYASRYKKFGNLCYVIGALQAFFNHHNRDFRIKVDGGEWEVCSQVTALCIGNAKFFGGGMKITPNADPSSGNFEVVILQDFKWHHFILHLHKLYNGTHLSVKNVSSRSAHSIEVEEVVQSDSIYVQSDGEYLGFLPRKFCILPGAIEMIR